MENEALVMDLVRWVATAPRPYSEVMEAWRTSCPRLTVWEDATELGFVRRMHSPDGTLVIEATRAGLEFLSTHTDST